MLWQSLDKSVVQGRCGRQHVETLLDGMLILRPLDRDRASSDDAGRSKEPT